MAAGPVGQPGLGVVQPQGGADRADVLGGVAVAEHHLDAAAALLQALPHLAESEHAVQDAGGGVQVGAGLEERDDVEDGAAVGRQRVLRQLVHGGDVVGGAGEADDVAAAGLHSEALLDPGDDPDGVQDLAGAVGQLPVGAVLAQFGQGRGVHLAVLADLQLGEVEPEGLGLPDEVLELAVGLPVRPGGGQGLLDGAQVGEERLGVRVGQVGVALAGGAQPGGGVQQEPAVRLVGRAVGDLRQQRRLSGAGRGERIEQGLRGGGEVAVGGEGAGDPVAGGLQAAQHVLGLDAHRLAGHLVGDVGVAVAVAADPGPVADERHGPGRADAGALGVQGPVQGTVDVRDDGEDGLVEGRQGGAHLVERVEPGVAQLGGAPEQVDLLQQAAVRLGGLGAALVGAVPGVELGADPQDGGGDGAAAGLGGVGGEHGVELHARDQRVEVLLSPGALADGADGRGQGLAGRVGGVVALAQRAHALVLLGQVGEVEVDGEGARDLLCAFQGPGGHQCGDLLAGDGTVAGADDRMTEFFDIGEQILAAALPEHGSEHLTEQLDVIPELFGHFLARTVALCAYRCHRADTTENGSSGAFPGAHFRAFALALTIVPEVRGIHSRSRSRPRPGPPRPPPGAGCY